MFGSVSADKLGCPHHSVLCHQVQGERRGKVAMTMKIVLPLSKFKEREELGLP